MAKKTNGVQNPPEASSKGGINDSTPTEQRSTKDPKVGNGPKKHEDTGAFLPASYKVGSGKLIRTDR